MPGFSSTRELVLASEGGAERVYSWRKTPAQTTTQGIWTDLSMAPGNPIPNYYANTPLVAAVLNGAEGIFHGGAVTPATKHLKRFMALSASATGLPLSLILCDYLLYYPFLDQGTTDPQALDNTVTLPRYANGVGVQILPVLVGAQTGGQTFSVSYTNSDGVAGRTSGSVLCNTATSTGAIVGTQQAANGAVGPFIPLQGTDTGVRSVESLTMAGADVGLMALVLVKPIASLMLRGVDAPVEVDFLVDRPSMPRIYDGAYLNLIALPMGNLSGIALHGLCETIWN